MLPLGILNAAQGFPMLVELKNGETYNGHLVNCDNWMNINLKEVVCTAADGEKFWRMPEIYIRGNTIKYLRIPDEVIDKVKSEWAGRVQSRFRGGHQRDGSSGSGGGRGSGRGGRGHHRQHQDLEDGNKPNNDNNQNSRSGGNRGGRGGRGGSAGRGRGRGQ